MALLVVLLGWGLLLLLVGALCAAASIGDLQAARVGDAARPLVRRDDVAA